MRESDQTIARGSALFFSGYSGCSPVRPYARETLGGWWWKKRAGIHAVRGKIFSAEDWMVV
jgi:hypothetical protein